MNDILSVILVLAILYGIVCVPVGMFNTKIFQACNGTKCTGLSLVKAFVPFYNITFSRKIFYTGAPVYNILLAICGLLLVFRLFTVVMVATFPVLVVYSGLAMVGGIALYFILYIINCVDFARMFSCGILVYLCSAVLPPVGYYILSLRVIPYYKSVEDTVSGTFESKN